LNENGIDKAISSDFSFFESKYSLTQFEIKAKQTSLIVALFFLESSLIFFNEISIETAASSLPDTYLECFFITLTSSFLLQ
jgi:hypothetical protein